MNHAARENGFGYWLRLILNTAVHYWRCGTRRALVRALWLTIVLGYYGEICEDCGSSYLDMVWWCPDDSLWAAAHPRSSGGLLCPRCFSRRSKLAGTTLLWEPRPLVAAAAKQPAAS